MTSMLRTKLSLKAEKNWHQNSGAKRREVISVRNMRPRAVLAEGAEASPEFSARQADVTGRHDVARRGPNTSGVGANDIAVPAVTGRLP